MVPQHTALTRIPTTPGSFRGMCYGAKVLCKIDNRISFCCRLSDGLGTWLPANHPTQTAIRLLPMGHTAVLRCSYLREACCSRCSCLRMAGLE